MYGALLVAMLVVYRRSGLVISREQGLRYDAGCAVPVSMPWWDMDVPDGFTAGLNVTVTVVWGPRHWCVSSLPSVSILWKYSKCTGFGFGFGDNAIDEDGVTEASNRGPDATLALR